MRSFVVRDEQGRRARGCRFGVLLLVVRNGVREGRSRVQRQRIAGRSSGKGPQQQHAHIGHDTAMPAPPSFDCLPAPAHPTCCISVYLGGLASTQAICSTEPGYDMLMGYPGTPCSRIFRYW